MNTLSSDFEHYELWLQKKQNEFRRNGYDQVSVEDLWEYCTDFLWKRQRPERYYQEIEDILSIQSNDYFNYASLKAQVYSISSLDEMELDDLLG
ncbi:hypothetical protein GCM10008932_17840 [Alkalibacterium iburiense]|uniref:Post-transcriptional regulator n=1 Tax=Alkalibacterium iburiense TaxID=290589 RepID=A0ABN0XKH2_9LACT